MKKCRKCNSYKEEIEFSLSRKQRRNTCKSCTNIKFKDYYSKLVKQGYYKDRYKSNKEKYSESCQNFRSHKPLEYGYSTYKTKAKQCNQVFALTFEEFTSLCNKECFYCGDTVQVGIDRFNNNLGYLLFNCVTCCKWCNRIKMEHSFEDLRKQLSKIYQKLISQEGMVH